MVQRCIHVSPVVDFKARLSVLSQSRVAILSHHQTLHHRPPFIWGFVKYTPVFTKYTPYTTPIPHYNMVCAPNIAPPYLFTTTVAQQSASVVQMVSDCANQSSFDRHQPGPNADPG
uniref:Uncharacterized protein n=1 Tax=Hyaloperonospora arabidopsidis (strain Emoy2) TaxID=559515 RepID=M4B302_HYAAE